MKKSIKESRKNSKKWFIVTEASMAVLVLILALMMFLEKRWNEPRLISVIVQNSDDSQWSAFRYGLKMAAQDEGVELFVVSTGDGMDMEEEMEIARREIDRGAHALIIQPAAGADTHKLLNELEQRVPVVLVESAAPKERDASVLPAVEPDHYAMGRSLAEELLKDYNGKIDGKSFGIVTENAGSEAGMKRQQGVLDVLRSAGAHISWFAQNSLESQPKVDVVLALDDSSLTAAGEYAAANNLHRALVYGIGHSTEAAYYLDTGIVACMVVPDGFYMGYQSLTQAAAYCQSFFYQGQDYTVSHTVIYREELYSKKNQELLFTMSQ